MVRYDIPRKLHGGFTRKLNEWPEAEINQGVLHCEIIAVDASESTSTDITRYLKAGADLNILGVSFFGNEWDAYYAETITDTPAEGRKRIAIQDCGEAAVRIANDSNAIAFGLSVQAEEDTQTIEGNSQTVTAVDLAAFTVRADTYAFTGAGWRTYQAEEMKCLGKAMEYQGANTTDDQYINVQITVLRPYILVPSA